MKGNEIRVTAFGTVANVSTRVYVYPYSRRTVTEQLLGSGPSFGWRVVSDRPSTMAEIIGALWQRPRANPEINCYTESMR